MFSYLFTFLFMVTLETKTFK